VRRGRSQPPSRNASGYVVRVYRWGGPGLRHIVGVVEEVGVEGRRAFTSVDELWQIFCATRRGRGRREARRSVRA